MDKYIKLQARVSSCLNNFFFFSYIHLCYNYNFAPSKWQVKPLFRRTTCIIHHVLTFFVLPSHPSSLSFLLILPTFCPTSRPLNCLQQQKSSGGFTATWKKKKKKKSHVLYHCVCTNPLQAQALLLLAQMTVPWQCSHFSHLSAPLDQSDTGMGMV